MLLAIPGNTVSRLPLSFLFSGTYCGKTGNEGLI
jgi:hypothetical protein